MRPPPPPAADQVEIRILESPTGNTTPADAAERRIGERQRAEEPDVFARDGCGRHRPRLQERPHLDHRQPLACKAGGRRRHPPAGTHRRRRDSCQRCQRSHRPAVELRQRHGRAREGCPGRRRQAPARCGKALDLRGTGRVPPRRRSGALVGTDRLHPDHTGGKQPDHQRPSGDGRFGRDPSLAAQRQHPRVRPDRPAPRKVRQTHDQTITGAGFPRST